MTHGQAISVFKNIRQGAVSLHIARRLHPQLPPFGKRSAGKIRTKIAVVRDKHRLTLI